MRAVILPHTGGPEALVLADVPEPRPATGEVVIDVHATALNFADLLQRKGTYGTPATLPGILGIECSGTVVALGEGVESWAVGDEVCALVSGGAYAERVAVPATQLLRRPRNVDLIMAAALPEAACTVWSNLVDISGLGAGDVLLVHGGAGGIGTFAIQTGRAIGARVFATAGGADKIASNWARNTLFPTGTRISSLWSGTRPKVTGQTSFSTIWARPTLPGTSMCSHRTAELQ